MSPTGPGMPRLPRAIVLPAILVSAVPLGYGLAALPFPVSAGALAGLLLCDALVQRNRRRTGVDAALTAFPLAGAGLLVAAAALANGTADAAQVAVLAVAAVVVYGLVSRAITIDSLAAVGCGVAYALLTLRGVHTGQLLWLLLALVPVGVLYLRTRLSRPRLGSVIDQCGAAIVAVDPDGRIVVWNAAMAELVGVPREHAIGGFATDFFQLVAEDGAPTPLTMGLRARARLATCTGRLLRVEVTSSSPAQATASGVLTAVFVDRSAQGEADRTRNLLLNSVRHELFGSLTTIRGHAQLLEAGVTGTGSPQAILDATEIMARVTEDLIRTAGTGAAAAVPTARTEVVDLPPLLRRTLRGVPAVAARTTVATPPELTVLGDPVRLRQCLLIVFTNADKYAPEGEIAITVRAQGGHAVVSIADSGPGLSPSERRRAPEPYYRSPATRSRPGSGMGLHIADVTMRAMRGGMRLAAAPSGGLEVVLWLPLSAEPR